MKIKSLNVLLLSLNFLSIGTFLQYASAGGGSTDVESFLSNPTTNLQFSPIYENNGELKIRVAAQQGDRQELIEKAAIANVVGWSHHDEAQPPYSLAVYKVQLLIGIQLYNDFPDYISAAKTYHTEENETTSEENVPLEKWGYMYKNKTYIRPDNTTHIVKTPVGQYMNHRADDLVQKEIKLCTRTSEEFSQWKWKTRHHIDRADIYKITEIRYEKIAADEAAQAVKTTSREEYRNRRYEGDAPSCGDRKLHG